MMESQQSLVLTRGLPASGKSTYAEAWLAQDPDNRVRVNRDTIRFELFSMWYPIEDERGTVKEKEQRVTDVERQRIEKALRSGKSVIVDNTNLNPKVFSTYGKIAKRFLVPLTHKDFPISIEETLRRNSLRERQVPEFVIRDMQARYMGPNGEFHLFPGDYPAKPFVEPQARQQAIAFDMDGTFADTRSIQHYVSGGKYRDFDGFHRASLFVPPNQQVLQMAMDAHAGGFKIIITTARGELYREVTQKWLDDHGVPYNNIFMRADKDQRPDHVVKTEMLQTLRKYYDMVRFVDDNPAAVSAWKNGGHAVTEVPFFGNAVTEDRSEIQIDNVFRSGNCVRCGRPVSDGATFGPRCARIR